MNDDGKIEQEYELKGEEELLIENEEKIYGKHFSQMTKDERAYLLLLKSKTLRRGVSFAKHALSRMDERYIKERDVLRALKNGQIIDYRKINDKEVITVRGCHVNRNKEQVYVVYCLTTRTIITTYSNKQWIKKYKNIDKYEKNFSIFIPEYYKRQINFYF